MICCSNEYQIFNKIVKLDYEYPDNGFDVQGRDLVEKLLVCSKLWILHALMYMLCVHMCLLHIYVHVYIKFDMIIKIEIVVNTIPTHGCPNSPMHIYL